MPKTRHDLLKEIKEMVTHPVFLEINSEGLESWQRAAIHYSQGWIHPEEEKVHTYNSKVPENNHHIRMSLNQLDHNGNKPDKWWGYVLQQKVWPYVSLYSFMLFVHRPASTASTFIQLKLLFLHKLLCWCLLNYLNQKNHKCAPLTAKQLGTEALFKGTFMLFTEGGERFTLSLVLKLQTHADMNRVSSARLSVDNPSDDT